MKGDLIEMENNVIQENEKLLMAFCPQCGEQFEKKAIDGKREHECQLVHAA